MKITIVSYFDCGGAGIAALRLHKALLQSGIDSSMLCISKATNTPKVYEYKRSLITKIIEHLPIPYKQNKYKKHYNKLREDYICTSFPEAIYDIAEHPLIKQADIINLHWVGEMLNYPKFFAKVKKPIVWTLHDNNPFLGIAHYRCEKELNLQHKELEAKICNIKSTAINKHNNVSVVNLCNWMKAESEKSNAFINSKHTIIPNSIDINTFKVYDKKTIRDELELPNDKPVILFVSHDVKNPWKGFNILKDAIEQLEKDCFLLIVGNSNSTLDIQNEHKFMGNIRDEQLMARIYAAADVFILPTLEDNLPNTMVESLCCGTPVISFSNGGMTDYIKTMKNGILVKEPNSKELLHAINTFLDNINTFDDRETISKENHKIFAPQLQAERYIEFFKSILKETH